MAELVLEGFQNLVDKLTLRIPAVVKRMAANAVANTASGGRRQEQLRANSLKMGRPQKKGSSDKFRVRSRWDARVGWTSTTREAGNGQSGFRMASFAWERTGHVKKGEVSAEYTNQLANLWAKETKPYSMDSRWVGSPGHVMKWKQGQKRPPRYSWSKVYSVLSDSMGPALARTERQYAPVLKKEMDS